MKNNTENDDFDFDDADGAFFVPSEYSYFDARRMVKLKQKYNLSKMDDLTVLKKYAAPEELKGLYKRWDDPGD